MSFTLSIALAFLIGSIPSGYIIGRLSGTDVRKSGSGNIGATNVGRVVGKSAGIATLIFDIVKGAAATFLPLSNFPEGAPLLGAAAILGHCFSPFLFFKGGKGVAAALGVYLALAPLQALGSVLLFIATVKITHYVSLGSLVGVLALPLLIALSGPSALSPGYSVFLLPSSVIISLVILIRHQGNIIRLFRGTENKIGSSKAKPSDFSEPQSQTS